MSSRATPAVGDLLTREGVATLVGVPLRKLTWWVYAFGEERRYTQFEIQRRSGAPRVINAPIKPIKDIQQELARHLAVWYDAPSHAHGFVTGRSPVTNAMRHRRQQWVLRVDLTDFFPSINFGRVRGLFMAYPFEFAPDVATLLAQICCHKNELPQGAPTSPMVSNFICRALDAQLAQLARDERCYYTRYADDLTFSTDRTRFPAALGSFQGPTSVVGPSLTEIINRNGFVANPAKTRLTRRTQRQRVTGLVVNDKLNVPREYIRSLRNLLYIWRRYGTEAAAQSLGRLAPHRNWPPEKQLPPFELIVRGRVQYVGAIKGWTSPVYLALADALSVVDPRFRSPSGSQPVAQRVRVLTEGTTDVVHLNTAAANLQSQGRLLGFKFEFETNGKGDSDLQKQLERLPGQRPDVVTICLFDRDNEPLLRKLDLKQQDWSDRGNGVAAAALVVPPFRTEPLCVEMLYDDTTLRVRDANGRRIYLRSEFDLKSGQHLAGEECTIARTDRDALIRDDVFEYKTSKSLALGKQDFASSVAAAVPPFDDPSFEGFWPTFDMLRDVATALARKLDPRQPGGTDTPITPHTSP